VLEVSLGGGAGGGVLAHTHGAVDLVHLTHFALLAVVVQAGICGGGGGGVTSLSGGFF